MSDNTNGPVVVVPSMSKNDRFALTEGLTYARTLGCDLVICAAAPGMAAVRPLFPQLYSEDLEHAETIEKKITDYLQETVLRDVDTQGLNVSIQVEPGTVHGAVLRFIETAKPRFVVVSGAAKEVASSPYLTAQVQLARHTQCPLLVARSTTGKAVLAATDLSDPSMPALSAAAAESKRRATALTIVHSDRADLTWSYFPADLPFVAPVVYGESERKELRQMLDDIAKKFGATSVRLESGPAAAAILGVAEDLASGLIVVGTHGRTGLMRMTMGSVAEAVLQGAACSVLVVRQA